MAWTSQQARLFAKQVKMQSGEACPPMSDAVIPPILHAGRLRWYDGDYNLHCVPAPTISDLDRLAIDELDTAIVVSGAP